MPTYYTDITVDEDGIGSVTARVVVSDTYAGLFGAGTAVDVLELKRTRRDLDVDTGVYAEDEAEMTLYEWASEAPDDIAAMTFVKEAQDPTVERYLAVFINPSTPPAAAEIEFRGRIHHDMDWVDVEWDNDEYVPADTIIREWNVTAGSYDITAILDQELWSDPDAAATGLADALDPVTLSVEDMLGYFYSDGTDGHGHREARFGDIVRFQPVVQGLLDAAAPNGITITYEATETALECATADFDPMYSDHRYFRYCWRWNPNPPGFPGYEVAPWHIPGTSGRFTLVTGNTGGVRDLAIDWKLLFGFAKDEEPLTWRKYKTLAELLYGLAAGWDMYVEFEHVSPTAITVRFKTRSDVIGDMIELRDALESSGNIAAVSGTDSRKHFVGPGTRFTGDGPYRYQFDGSGFVQKVQDFRPDFSGDRIPLTISAVWCDYTDMPAPRPQDAGRTMNGERNNFGFPHNCIFYGADDTMKAEADPDLTFPTDGRYTTRGVHTGVYAILPAGPGHKGHGIDGKTVALPVRAFWARGEGSQITAKKDVAAWLNEVRGFDVGFFKKELNQTVPGLMGFRKSGVYDWRNCVLGAQHIYSGLTHTIAGIERNYDPAEWSTTIRSQESSRFTLDAPVITDDADGVDGQDIRSKGDQFIVRFVSDDVTMYNVVSIDNLSGLQTNVHQSVAHESDYRLVLGIALLDAVSELGEKTIIQLHGVCEGAASVLPAGTPDGTVVFVRSGTTNLSIEPLRGKTDTENLYQQIGIVSGDDIVIDIKESRIYQ